MTSAATATTATVDLLGFTVDEGGGGGGAADVDFFSPSPDDHQQRAEQPKGGVTETNAVVAEDCGGRGEGGLRGTTQSPSAAVAASASASASEEADADADAEKAEKSAPSHPTPLIANDGGGGCAAAASDDDYATPPEEDGSCTDEDVGDGRADADAGDEGALRQQRQAAIDAINAIHLEMDELEARAKSDGTVSAALVHELVTQICCRLDGIDTHGSDEVRSMRRAAIARAEGIDDGGCGTGFGVSSQQDGDAPVPTEPERRGLDGINPFDEFRDVLPSPPATKPEKDRPPGAPAPPTERKPIMNNAPAALGGGMDVFMNATTSGGNITASSGDGGVDKDKQNNHMIVGPVQNSVVTHDPPTAASGAAEGESRTDRDQRRLQQHPDPTNTSTAQADLLTRATAQRPELGQPRAPGQGEASSDTSLPLVSTAGGDDGAGTNAKMDVFAGLFGAATGDDGGGEGRSADAPPTPPAPVDTDTTPTTSTPGTARSSAGNLSVDEIVLAAPSSLVPSTPPVVTHGKVGTAGREVMDLSIGLFDGDVDDEGGDDRPSPLPTPAGAAAAAVPATEASTASQSATGAAAPAPAPAPSSFSSSPQMQNLQQQLDAWEATRASAAAAAPVSPTGSTDRKKAATTAAGDDDPFGIFGGSGATATADGKPLGNGVGGTSTPSHRHGPVRVGSGSGTLPPDGVTYETKIYAARVGIMFLTARHLTDTLFLAVPDDEKRRLLSVLGERPVVAFMVEGSGGLDAGVKLGHVLLSVDGTDVSNPADAQRRIAEGPRPLPVKFYIPDVPIVSAEGMHMVKYDVNTTYAPSTSGEWKLKYVVVGGVIAKKWQINMYRSKADYDEAVSAVLAGRPIPVKIKQFSLVGGSRMLDDGDVKTVRYNDRPKAWRYVVVERPEIPGSFPIKIAHGSVEGLRPVMRGIQYAMAGRNETKAPIAKTGRKGKSNPGFFQPMLGRKAKKKSSKTKI